MGRSVQRLGGKIARLGRLVANACELVTPGGLVQPLRCNGEAIERSRGTGECALIAFFAGPLVLVGVAARRALLVELPVGGRLIAIGRFLIVFRGDLVAIGQSLVGIGAGLVQVGHGLIRISCRLV